jgi:hypothetical protein
MLMALSSLGKNLCCGCRFCRATAKINLKAKGETGLKAYGEYRFKVAHVRLLWPASLG